MKSCQKFLVRHHQKQLKDSLKQCKTKGIKYFVLQTETKIFKNMFKIVLHHPKFTTMALEIVHINHHPQHPQEIVFHHPKQP